jgi:serine 3-dehydrogenase (NADP+)
MDLKDKVFVVTGASSGIGDAVARELSGASARLVITARRAERLASLASALPGPCAMHAAAIEERGTAQSLLDLALAQYGRVDGLINNAGLFVAGSVDTIDLDELAQMTRVNFDAAVRAAYVFGRHFKAQGSGAIINVSSVAAYLSSSSVGAYSGLKHALEVFTTALRVELAPFGVRVGSIAPGTTETEIFDRLRAAGQPVRADRTPPLAPADIAHAVRFMLEQPDRANVARLLLVSAAESA